MTTQEREILETMLQSTPNPNAPIGFADRLEAKMHSTPILQYEQPNYLQVSGVLSIASSIVFFVVSHSPMFDEVLRLIKTIGGIFS